MTETTQIEYRGACAWMLDDRRGVSWQYKRGPFVEMIRFPHVSVQIPQNCIMLVSYYGSSIFHFRALDNSLAGKKS